VPVDDAHVYWTNSVTNAIGRANLDGTGVDQSFITGAIRPHGVAVHGAHVYWTHSPSRIGRANLDGTGVNQTFIIFPIPIGANPSAVAVDDNSIYWTNFGTQTIGRADIDGSSANPSYITGASGPFGVALAGDNIYSLPSRDITGCIRQTLRSKEGGSAAACPRQGRSQPRHP
jgi:virginiamycin B lyase